MWIIRVVFYLLAAALSIALLALAAIIGGKDWAIPLVWIVFWCEMFFWGSISGWLDAIANAD